MSRTMETWKATDDRPAICHDPGLQVMQATVSSCAELQTPAAIAALKTGVGALAQVPAANIFQHKIDLARSEKITGAVQALYHNFT